MRKIIDRMKNREGFTLAELLIVVAIIAVLVAISIPVFTNQLEKSREAVDISNLRAAYAAGQVAALTDLPGSAVTKWYNPLSGTLVDAGTACGKGTSTTTSGTIQLPNGCAYASATDVTAMGIKVVYDNTGVTSCAFEAP